MYLASASHSAAPQPGGAALVPAAESLGLAVCVVGQLARLELRSKLVNLLELHGPERAGLFLSLERGGAEYVNPKTRPDSSSNCDSEFDNATLLEAVGPYLRDHEFPEHETYPTNLAAWPMYRKDVVCDSRRRHHLQSHHAQHAHDRRCYSMMLKEEARTGKQYEALVRLRDNGVVASPMEPLKLVARAASNELAYSPQDKVAAEHGHHHGEALAVFIKPCFSWDAPPMAGFPGIPGVNDKLIVVPRPLVKAAIGLSFDTMSSIWTAPPPNMTTYFSKMRLIASQVTNAETLLSALLRLHNVTVRRPAEGLPVIDSRCFNSTTKGEADLNGKRWCAVPSCKDCSPGNWNLPGYAHCPAGLVACPGEDKDSGLPYQEAARLRAAGVCVNGSEWAREKLIKT